MTSRLDPWRSVAIRGHPNTRGARPAQDKPFPTKSDQRAGSTGEFPRSRSSWRRRAEGGGQRERFAGRWDEQVLGAWWDPKHATKRCKFVDATNSGDAAWHLWWSGYTHPPRVRLDHGADGLEVLPMFPHTVNTMGMTCGSTRLKTHLTC